MKTPSVLLLGLVYLVGALGFEVLNELKVFPKKDATNFRREGFGENGPAPVELILTDEKCFAAVEIVTTENVTVEFELFVDGDSKGTKQFLASVAKPTVLSLLDEVDQDEGFFTVSKRGTKRVRAIVKQIDGTDAGQVLTEFFDVYVISGFGSVFPLLFLIFLALISRNVYVSMFFGIWMGSFIIAKGDIVQSFKDLFDVHMIPSITESSNFRTVTFTLFLAGFISMIKRAGGQDGFSDAVGRYATSPRKTQLAAVFAGVGLFFDDYSSVLILGSSFKKLTDRFYVSREKLAFVADSTSAPIASIAPISSWIAFELSRIRPELENIKQNSGFASAQDLQSEYPFFLTTIPSRYYPFYMLVIQIVLIFAGVEFGPMLYAERKTRLGKRTDGGDGRMEIPVEQDYTNPADDTPRRAWNFFVPLGFFIVSLLTSLINIGKETIDSKNAELAPGEDKIEYLAREVFGNTDSFAALVYCTMGASLFALLFFFFQMKYRGEIVMPTKEALKDAMDCRIKNSEDVAIQEGIEINPQEKDFPRPIMYFTEGVNTWVEGFKNLVPSILILCMAFTVKSIVSGCATDRFFTDIILESDLSAEALPTIIFVVASLLSLATGSSFGTMSIMFPLMSFATFEKSEGDIELFTLALSSIMAGAIFGDHSSLISDTTILASIGSGCSIGSHVYTQMPYAIWGGIWAMMFGTLPAGFGANPSVILVFGMIALSIFTILVSAPIVARSGRLDMFSEFWLKITKNQSMHEFKVATREFAKLNPDMVDEEVWDWFYSLRTGRKPGQEDTDSLVDNVKKDLEEEPALESQVKSQVRSQAKQSAKQGSVKQETEKGSVPPIVDGKESFIDV